MTDIEDQFARSPVKPKGTSRITKLKQPQLGRPPSSQPVGVDYFHCLLHHHCHNNYLGSRLAQGFGTRAESE